MKVIFLDFDGVLNSMSSFIYEGARRKKDPTLKLTEPPVNETLCNVCTAVFQRILEECPDVKIVISSTWRNLFEMDWLKEKLAFYGIDSSRVIDKTPQLFFRPRGSEISEWLSEHPEVTDYVILDDNSDMTVHMHKFVQTDWFGNGLSLNHANEVIKRLNQITNTEEK